MADGESEGGRGRMGCGGKEISDCGDGVESGGGGKGGKEKAQKKSSR